MRVQEDGWWQHTPWDGISTKHGLSLWGSGPLNPSLLAQTMVRLIFLRQQRWGPRGREGPTNNLVRDRRTETVMEESSSLTRPIILLSWLDSALCSALTPLLPPSICFLSLCCACWEYSVQPCFSCTSVCLQASFTALKEALCVRGAVRGTQ